MKINNKGFTLMEVLAVVVIISILGLISVPSVLNIINTGKNSSYEILVKDITIAAKQLYEEIEYMKVELYNFDINDGKKSDIIKINNEKKIEVNLQTLVSNGFLMGSNNPNVGKPNQNYKIITNPKTGEDMGDCSIIVTKIVNNNTFVTSYTFEPKSDSSSFCPTKDDYQKALNKKERE